LCWIGPAAALLGACDGGGGGGGTGPLPISASVSLGPTEYTLLRGSAIGGRVQFPAADANGAQYLVVAQFATGVHDIEASVQLTSGGAPSARVVAGSPEFSLAQLPAGPAERFHELLRRKERELRRLPVAAAPAPRAPAPPPAVGSQRTFKVCNNLQCSTLANVPATAMYVGSHAAIFLDDSVPPGGFTQADLDDMGAVFDGKLYPIDVAAFGAESDIDANGVVIILLTRKINALVPRPECETSFVTGYFFGADLAPGIAPSYNNGEVFYGFVPDPEAQVACAYSRDMVRALLPVTFAHEFQHMISFNQHFLVRNGDAEVLWLNEALSHLAEELVGLHYDSLGQTTTARPYLRGNFYNAFQYLKNPNATVMVSDSPPGSLASRGGGWLFARYLADRFGMTAIGRLVATNRVGAANVAAATGTDFSDLLGHWALAVYVTDLPDFAAPAALRFTTWSFREEFAALNAQSPSIFTRPYPLVPASGNPSATVSGMVMSGSGVYAVLTQPGSAVAFELSFRTASGGALPANAAGQLAIVRIR
jgi:hypothetical protein